jgi:immune inhibitor A
MWLAVEVQAMPPNPELLAKIKAGELPVPYYLQQRDELAKIGVDNPSQLRLNKGAAILPRMSLSGNQKILTILIDFSDKVAATAAGKFDTLVYGASTGTVMDYFDEVSYGTLTITTIKLPSALGWRRAPQTLAYYANSNNGLGSYPQNAQKLVESAVDLIDSLVDFSQFDNDDDGYVDGLFVVHAGRGAELTGSANDIWSHQWAISPRLKDGVYISTYSMEPEYWTTPGDMTCGVYCHELGHVFGLPDLYDTDYSSEGVGKWSLMAGGSWNGTLGNSPAHLDPWCKIQMGFITPITPTSNQTGVSINQVETNATAYKLWTNGVAGNEFFLVENRQRTGYDTPLPNSGLLIWHIDQTRSNNDSEYWPSCGWTAHYKVALVQADNLWQMEHNINNGDAADPYPGTGNKRVFGNSAAPGSNSYAGSATNVAVANISNSGSVMTADLVVTSEQGITDNQATIPNKVVLDQNYPNPFNSSTNIGFELLEESFVKIEVVNLGGSLVKQLCAMPMAVGYHGAFWDGLDSQGKKVGTGVYFYKLNIDGKSICKKMLLLK